MHPLARPPVCEVHLKRQVGTRAFTLIELLTVIAIIAILAGIAFGVIRGVNERSAIGQAKAELSVLSQALEAYKMQYGDYPWTDSHVDMYRALIGVIGPKGASVTNGKRFIDTSRFSLSDTNPGAAGNHILDPWGRPYKYFYKTGDGSAWRAPTYILYSSGPLTTDETNPSAAGVVNTTTSNLDNIYANK